MKTKKVNDHLKDYYNAQSLTEEKMKLLLEMNKQSTKASSSGRAINIFSRQRFILVASLAFLLITAWGISNFEQNQSFKSSLTERIAQEIALNHRKQLSLDFKGKDYQSLNVAMTKLDFKMMKSNNAQLLGLELVGARYCSIQGNIAAQLRFRDKNGKYFSLYQTKLTALLKNKPNSLQHVNQIKVTQWQEGNLFYGLAESVDSAS